MKDCAIETEVEKVVFTGIADSDFPNPVIIKGQKVLAECEVEYGVEEEIKGFGEYKKIVKKRVVKKVRNKKLDGIPCENWAAGQVNNEWRIFYIQPEIMHFERIAQCSLRAIEEELATNKRKDVIQKLLGIGIRAAEEIEVNHPGLKSEACKPLVD